MSRLARFVFAQVPHHITQRENRREDIFLTDEDRETYLAWLEDYCQQHGVDILAYCLMTNPIHLVAVPATEDALQRVLKPVPMRYAQRRTLSVVEHGGALSVTPRPGAHHKSAVVGPVCAVGD